MTMFLPPKKQSRCSLLILTSLIWLKAIAVGQTLPPANDIPEEILRTEIITEGRSPIDGKPLSASEYAELEQQLAENQNHAIIVDPKIRQLVFLLKVRKFFKTIFSFL